MTKKINLDPRSLGDGLAEISTGSLLNELGVSFYRGELGEPDFTRARKYYTEAARYHSPDASFHLADVCYRGIGGEKDEKYSIALLERNILCHEDGAKGAGIIAAKSLTYLMQQIHKVGSLTLSFRSDKGETLSQIETDVNTGQSIFMKIDRQECKEEYKMHARQQIFCSMTA